ncbi:uncharacterized protein LOC129595429 [Paramacrobiotus metropolitanus]|uniref:uncharacterized protein LOC129595429 n=1 Tax=Paramacrobiotus metropolitanus TaxID=2943436 RepID=UPI002446487B|nr:uncharacterized protein LOC129595429 [Paramacrobiotus metropolitanus]
MAARLHDSESRKSSTTVYMVCSALGNLCILWSILPDYITATVSFGANVENGSDQANDSYANFYTAYKGFAAFLNETATQFADWTLIIFAVERLLVALRPLSNALTRTVTATWRRAILKECAILSLSIMFSVSNLCTYYYYYISGNRTLILQDDLPPPLKTWYQLQEDAEMGMWYAKWLTMLILDISLIVVLWRHRTAFRKSVIKRSKTCGTRTANATVLGSLLLYMVTQLPYVLLSCLKIASRPPYCSYPMTYEQESRARPIVYIVQWSNYSVTFLVYYSASLTFRKQCRALCKTISHPARQAHQTLTRIITVTKSAESSTLKSAKSVTFNTAGNKGISAPEAFEFHNEMKD